MGHRPKGKAQRTPRQAIRELEEKGFIERTQYGGLMKQPNLFTFSGEWINWRKKQKASSEIELFLYICHRHCFLMCASDVRTTGYRLADGRYFIIEDAGGEVVAIRQILFGCGIYPAPVKDVPGSDWPGVLANVKPKEKKQ